MSSITFGNETLVPFDEQHTHTPHAVWESVHTYTHTHTHTHTHSGSHLSTLFHSYKHCRQHSAVSHDQRSEALEVEGALHAITSKTTSTHTQASVQATGSYDLCNWESTEYLPKTLLVPISLETSVLIGPSLCVGRDHMS